MLLVTAAQLRTLGKETLQYHRACFFSCNSACSRDNSAPHISALPPAIPPEMRQEIGRLKFLIQHNTFCSAENVVMNGGEDVQQAEAFAGEVCKILETITLYLNCRRRGGRT